MKFTYGDRVVIDDGFAVYRGRVTGHKLRRRWPLFWKMADWYLVQIESINNEYASGAIVTPENEITAEANYRKGHLRPINLED